MKNLEQYKHIVRISACLVLFLIEMFMYYYVWHTYYNHLMQIPYYRLGNWMMFGVYGIVLVIFSYIYGGMNIGGSKIFTLIYSHFLISLFSNVVMYVAGTLVIKALHTVAPLLLLTLVEVLIIAIWSVIVTNIYQRIYPPRKVLLVYGDRPMVGFVDKLYSRMDRFIIGDTISVSDKLEDIEKKAEAYDGVIIGDIPTEIRNKILKYCYGRSIRTYTIPKLSDIIIKNSESLHMFDTPLLLSRNLGLNIEQMVIKRLMDIVISLFALILFSPVLLITAILIKRYDHGPIFFSQKRCTKDQRIFNIYKFRSMVVDAEKKGVVIPATDDDPRITRIGKIIRKFRIDELPQLVNILMGDMSLVGPRPERIEHVQEYSKEIPEFCYRMKVKGGLTGYAQVYGKYNTTAYDKLKLDLMYIENYSVLLDIEILFKTVKILFIKESTEGFDKEVSCTMANQFSSLKDNDENAE
ncbi:sugar transferase [Lacrimispora sp.]|uniref:sugar transferase n=1 Tax=Lacrimispora sp. TaxID=2719234 RepID=UPI00345FA555